MPAWPSAPNNTRPPHPLYLQKAIANDNIEEGLDRKNLTLLRKRFTQLNSERLQRIDSALPERQRIFLALLPLLFHVNHPMLPGYINGKTPAGVSGFTPTEADTLLARRITRSFKYSGDVKQSRQIHAIFVMGSAGTVAHSDASDLDIWLCHNPRLSEAGLALLQKKCSKLSAWADELGLEAHFFPMNAEAFKRGEQSGLDSESSGSSQRFLLLDEFYRSAVHIAGRTPLWWLVPSNCENQYDSYTDTLLGKRFIRASEVIDFGCVAHIPASEFAGAGIWQLYKGIDSPYKSVLKLLLLESYTSGGLPALSLEFKAAVYQGQTSADQLDAYALIYQRIELYLLKIDDSARLDLARRCFYFKVDKLLSKPPHGRAKSWQRQLLERLVAEWHWSPEDICRLDNRRQWKAVQVMRERHALVSQLSASYRLLIEFVRQQGASCSVDKRELQVLGRKLHAAFERKAGKLEWINPGISQDTSEPKLRLQQCENLWQVFNNHTDSMPSAPIKQGRYFLELLLWCHGNGLLIPNSKLEIEAEQSPHTAQQIMQMRQILQQWLPLPLPSPPHQVYLAPSNCESVMLWINSDCNPNPSLTDQGLVLTSDHDDPLNFGRDHQNLVASVDLITRSSWNEINSFHFEGQSSALIDALLQLLRLTNSGLPNISVHCFTAHHGKMIGLRIEKLLSDINRHLYHHGKASHWRFIFSLNTQHYVLQLKRGQPNIKACANRADLLRTLSWPQRHRSPIAIDGHSLIEDPLQAIANSPSNATLQIYYRAYQDSHAYSGISADIYVLDEMGSLFSCQQPFWDHQSLLRPLHRFLRRVLECHTFTDPNHNPDFGVKPIDFYELGPNFELLRQQVGTDLNPLRGFDIEVSVETDVEGRHRYNIYCEQKEFSSLVDGDQLFNHTAEYILSRRPSGERYPCFITNLDISQCAANIAGDHGLQIIHYLNLKTQLEQQLNSALKTV